MEGRGNLMCCMDWIGSDIVEKTANVVPAWVCVGRELSIGVGWLVSRIYSDIRVMLNMGHYERVYAIGIRAVGLTYPVY